MTLQHNNVEVILGPPGTGKTTELFKLIEQDVKSGIKPDRICFISYTNAAISEAKSRVTRDLVHLEVTKNDFAYMQTLHALCVKLLGYHHEVMRLSHWHDFGEWRGQPCNSGQRIGGKAPHYILKDVMQMARRRGVSIEQQLRDQHITEITLEDALKFVRDLEHYKANKLVREHDDVLVEFIERQYTRHFDVLYVDEAQDLAPLQWQVVQLLATRSQKVIIAGDDDQAIYNWAGSDTQAFVDLPGRKRVLTKSHRLPRKVHTYSQQILGNIHHRIEKSFEPQNEIGGVFRVNKFSDIYPLIEANPDETWLILSRTNGPHTKMSNDLMQKHYWFGSTINKRSGSMLTKNLEKLARAYLMWQKLHEEKELDENDSLTLLNGLGDEGRRYLEVCCDTRNLNQEKCALPNINDPEASFYFDKSGQTQHFLDLVRLGRSITIPPKIVISSIHQAKGMEADNVFLDMSMTAAVQQELRVNPDREHRVWYVGATRARKRLFLCPNHKLTKSYPCQPMYWDRLQIEKA